MAVKKNSKYSYKKRKKQQNNNGLYLGILLFVFFGSFLAVIIYGTVIKPDDKPKTASVSDSKENSLKVTSTSWDDMTEEGNETDNENGNAAGNSKTQSDVITDSGLNFGLVFDMDGYLSANADIADFYKDQSFVFVFENFLKYGMAEGRTSSASFNIGYYMDHFKELSKYYRSDTMSYYLDYVMFGKEEGRYGNDMNEPEKSEVIDFSLIYDQDTFFAENPDLMEKAKANVKVLEINPDYERLLKVEALKMFLGEGMEQGRIAHPTFDPKAYMSAHPEYAEALGDEVYAYTVHYVLYGCKESH